MVLVSVYPCITGYVYLLGDTILWPLDYRFALKQSLLDPLYTIPLVIALIMVWKTKDAALHKKYITKGLFISSFICFYLVL
jgi:inner membrane protein